MEVWGGAAAEAGDSTEARGETERGAVLASCEAPHSAEPSLEALFACCKDEKALCSFNGLPETHAAKLTFTQPDLDTTFVTPATPQPTPPLASCATRSDSISVAAECVT